LGHGGETFFIAIVFCLSLCTCGNLPPIPKQPPPEDFWNGAADTGTLVFYGAAGLRRDIDESVRLALEDAARRVAMFGRVRGHLVSQADTIKTSYENAVLSIVRAVSSTVQGDTTEIQGSGAFDFSLSAGNRFSAEAVLREFYILDFWIDPKDLAVWTLATARADTGEL
jgi:hypothetical protein